MLVTASATSRIQRPPVAVLAQTEPAASIELEREAVSVGDSFEAYLWVEDVDDLSGFDAVVLYDEGYLALQGVELIGAFLESGGREMLALEPELAPGRISLGAVTIPASGQAGADGAGDLAVFRFRALAAGETVLRIAQVNLVSVSGTQWTIDGRSAAVLIVGQGQPTPTPGGPTATPATPRDAFLPWASRRQPR